MGFSGTLALVAVETGVDAVAFRSVEVIVFRSIEVRRDDEVFRVVMMMKEERTDRGRCFIPP